MRRRQGHDALLYEEKIVGIYCYYRTSPTVNFLLFLFFFTIPIYTYHIKLTSFGVERSNDNVKCNNAHGRDNRMTDLTVQRYYIIITTIIFKIWEKLHECIRFHIYIFILRRRVVIYRFIHICVCVLNNIMDTIQYDIIMVPTKWI